MTVVLDTHAWIWWAADPRRLSARARQRIDEAATIGVCAISCWEVGMLVARGRLELDRDELEWMEQALALPRCTLLALTPSAAVTAARLPASFPGDPADRLIVATAMDHAAPIVTRDARIRGFAPENAIW